MPATIRRSPSRRLVARAGEHLEHRLFSACATPEPVDVDLDLAGADALDAETAAMLVHARFVLRQRGRELRITTWPPGSTVLLESCGLLEAAPAGPLPPAPPDEAARSPELPRRAVLATAAGWLRGRLISP
jgi:anti-anti-sigma regulatory factor